jgi:hypothetical protein
MRYSFTIILKAKRCPLSFLHKMLDMNFGTAPLAWEVDFEYNKKGLKRG